MFTIFLSRFVFHTSIERSTRLFALKYLYVSSCVLPCGTLLDAIVNKLTRLTDETDPSVQIGVKLLARLCVAFRSRLYFKTANNRELLLLQNFPLSKAKCSSKVGYLFIYPFLSISWFSTVYTILICFLFAGVCF